MYRDLRLNLIFLQNGSKVCPKLNKVAIFFLELCRQVVLKFGLVLGLELEVHMALRP